MSNDPTPELLPNTKQNTKQWGSSGCEMEWKVVHFKEVHAHFGVKDSSIKSLNN
jgi:hypothetical protein